MLSFRDEGGKKPLSGSICSLQQHLNLDTDNLWLTCTSNPWVERKPWFEALAIVCPDSDMMISYVCRKPGNGNGNWHMRGDHGTCESITKILFSKSRLGESSELNQTFPKCTEASSEWMVPKLMCIGENLLLLIDNISWHRKKWFQKQKQHNSVGSLSICSRLSAWPLQAFDVQAASLIYVDDPWWLVWNGP